MKVPWAGEPFPVKEQGWARCHEVLDTKERLKEYIEVSIALRQGLGSDKLTLPLIKK